VGPFSTEITRCDAAITLLSVPGLLGTNLETIPGNVPYVMPDPGRVAFWQTELAKLPGRRVGIVWQGSQEHKGDRLRSVSLTRFAELGKVDGVCLCSLQKGPGVEQLLDGLAGEIKVHDLAARTQSSYADTAALMKALDLVVTVDTSVAHVAGAMGIPVWVVLPFAADWRWLQHREDTPWYPTMRLFRQTNRGNWDEVFARVALALKK
jgi:ADP-heptose:LPS heptosyltransferase